MKLVAYNCTLPSPCTVAHSYGHNVAMPFCLYGLGVRARRPAECWPPAYLVTRGSGRPDSRCCRPAGVVWDTVSHRKRPGHTEWWRQQVLYSLTTHCQQYHGQDRSWRWDRIPGLACSCWQLG